MLNTNLWLGSFGLLFCAERERGRRRRRAERRINFEFCPELNSGLNFE
jgi:hypothetical protein